MSSALVSTKRSTTTTAASAATARGRDRLLQAESPVIGCEPNLGENTRLWSSLMQLFECGRRTRRR